MRMNALDCDCTKPSFEDSEASFKNMFITGLETYSPSSLTAQISGSNSSPSVKGYTKC